MARMLGLNHIHLYVSDLERSIAFYRRVFGLEVLSRDGSLAFMRTPGCLDTVTLHETTPLDPRPGSCGGIAHFGFRLADRGELDSVIAEAERAGAVVIQRGEHRPGRRFAYLQDPDGYVVEV